MFDFDGLETDDPSDKLDHDVVQRIADGLEHSAWKERCDACRLIPGLGLGEWALPLLPTLKSLCDADPDHEVRKAARKALDALRDEGVQLRSAAVATERKVRICSAPETHQFQVRVEEVRISAPADDGFPRANFKINKEVLSMRLEAEDMTPNDLAEVWERRWGVQYAKRIRFRAQPDADVKWLNSREEFVPRAPLVVELDAGAGSILYSLATAMRQYGEMSADEAGTERVRRLEQKVTAEPVPPPRQALGNPEGGQREKRAPLRKPWKDGPPLLLAPEGSNIRR